MTLWARLARGVRGVLCDYRLNWIYASPSRMGPVVLPPGLEARPLASADLGHFARSADAQARKVPGYHESGASGFVLAEWGRAPLGAAHYCGRDRYPHDAIWPLASDQLALVDIVMLPEARGRGLAAPLIAAATGQALADGGQGSAICFIWWNHRASLRAFRRAGWRAIGFSVELTMRSGRIRHWRTGWGRGG